MAEDDPWGFDDTAEEEPAAPASATGSATGSGSAAAGSKVASAIGSATAGSKAPTPDKASITGGESVKSGQGAAEVEPEEVKPPPPPEDDGYRKPVQLYRHWVRPKFLQYKYMYNYRTNYYDDVIDYLDKKQVGVTREIPRPQTWAERVLRTKGASGSNLDSYAPSTKRERQLIQTLAASIRPYNYHTKAYINQKYSSVL